MKKNNILLFVFFIGLLIITACSAQEAVVAANSDLMDAGMNTGSFSSTATKSESDPHLNNQTANRGENEDVFAPTALPSTEPMLDAARAGNSNLDPEQSSPDDSNNEAMQGLLPAEPSIGYLAPDINLPTLDGAIVNLSQLRGKNVLINYWVTWCVPCMDELPALERLYKDYQQQDLVILSINGVEENELSEVELTVDKFGLTYPILLDERNSFHDAYWIQFLPTTFFIDKQGIIRDILKGSTSEQGFRTRIEQLIFGTY